jgi:hypothetical protein
MKVFASIFCLLFLSPSAYSQSDTIRSIPNVNSNVKRDRQLVTPDTILLNNGKVLITQVVDTIGENITVLNPKSRKHKKIEINKEGVFSIKFGSTGKEDVLYIYDTLVGHDFTVDDARKFIAGEQDAIRGYHAVGVSIAAFAIGFVSGDYEGSFFGAFPPFLFDGIMTYPAIHVRHKSVRDMKIANTDPYLYGYYLAASSKRMLHSFLWSGIGLVTGLATNFIFVNNLQGVTDIIYSWQH